MTEPVPATPDILTLHATAVASTLTRKPSRAAIVRQPENLLAGGKSVCDSCEVADGELFSTYLRIEPDPFELPGQLLDLGLVQIVLEGERLELGSLEVPTLLGTLDERLGLVGIKQFVQLILCQVSLSSPTL